MPTENNDTLKKHFKILTPKTVTDTKVSFAC